MAFADYTYSINLPILKEKAVSVLCADTTYHTRVKYSKESLCLKCQKETSKQQRFH